MSVDLIIEKQESHHKKHEMEVWKLGWPVAKVEPLIEEAHIIWKVTTIAGDDDPQDGDIAYFETIGGVITYIKGMEVF